LLTRDGSIFLPKSHDPASSQKLPTLFTIHGGGFVVGTPEENDAWNAAFAARFPVLVIALNYAKAPVSVFPTAVYDVEQLLLAALADDSLPIDHGRVATLGFSAGGNLALSVSTLPSLRGGDSGPRRVHAAVPVYAVLDFTVPQAAKTRSRPYKPALGGVRGKTYDLLTMITPVFDWAYIPRGQDLADPLLSPIYAPPEHLPSSVFMIGCELDMLAGEAWRMIRRLAGRGMNGVEEMAGREEVVAGKGELILDDQRFCFEERKSGRTNYKWLLVPDTIHGFDQTNIEVMVRDKELLEDARLKTAESQKAIGEWLFAGPFAASLAD